MYPLLHFCAPDVPTLRGVGSNTASIAEQAAIALGGLIGEPTILCLGFLGGLGYTYTIKRLC